MGSEFERKIREASQKDRVKKASDKAQKVQRERESNRQEEAERLVIERQDQFDYKRLVALAKSSLIKSGARDLLSVVKRNYRYSREGRFGKFKLPELEHRLRGPFQDLAFSANSRDNFKSMLYYARTESRTSPRGLILYSVYLTGFTWRESTSSDTIVDSDYPGSSSGSGVPYKEFMGPGFSSLIEIPKEKNSPFKIKIDAGVPVTPPEIIGPNLVPPALIIPRWEVKIPDDTKGLIYSDTVDSEIPYDKIRRSMERILLQRHT